MVKKKKTASKSTSIQRKPTKSSQKKNATHKSHRTSKRSPPRHPLISRAALKSIHTRRIKKMSQEQVEAAIFGSKPKTGWFFLSTGISLSLLLAFAFSFLSPSVGEFLKASIFNKPSLRQLQTLAPEKSAEFTQIKGKIITCSDPSMCNHTDVESVLVQVLQGLTLEKLYLDSPTAEAYVSSLNPTSFPAFILEKQVEKSDVWFAMKDFFTEYRGSYIFKTELLNSGDQWVETPPELTAENAVIGQPDAPLTITEFVDYTNLQSRQFFLEVQNLLKAKYIDTGKVNFTVVSSPSADEESSFVANAMAIIYRNAPQNYWEARREITLEPSREKIASILSSLNIAEIPNTVSVANSSSAYRSGTILVGHKLYFGAMTARELERIIEIELKRHDQGQLMTDQTQ